MATVTKQPPEPAEPTYMIVLSQDEALELAGVLGRLVGLLTGGLYWDLMEELEGEVGDTLVHPRYAAGATADITPPSTAYRHL